jgi:regulator of sigma E protease
VDAVVYILIGLVGLTLVVTIHEAGHYFAARWAGVEVEAFAIGWGKVLWSWKPKTTEYRICLLPLGGYCKMKGEQDLMAALERQDGAFESAPGSLFGARPWKRIVISAAGPAANLVFAFLVFFSLQLTGIPETGPAARVLLASEIDGRIGLPADQAGLKTGDQVLSVDGKAVVSFSDLQQAISASGGKPQAWKVTRQGSELVLTVTPRWEAAEKRSLVGIYPLIDPVVKEVKSSSPAALAGFEAHDRITAIDGTPVTSTQAIYQAVSTARAKGLTFTVTRNGASKDLLFVPEGTEAKEGPGLVFDLPTFPARGLPASTAVAEGWTKTWSLFAQMVEGLGQLFTGKANVTDSLSGPLRITYYVGEVASQGFLAGWGQGWGAVANFLAFISLAVFLMNLLPIPALDGGSIVVSTVEVFRRRRIGAKALMRYQQVGMVLVLGLVLFTTFNDLGFLFGPK